MMTESEINWDVLRKIVTQDRDRWTKMADDPKWSNFSVKRFHAKAEAMQDVLDSMDTLEHTIASLPGLAEHTAAACDTITKAATC